MIRTWKEYLDAWFEEDDNGVIGINRELRPEMSDRFRRRYGRVMMRAHQSMESGGPQRYIDVTVQKHRARKRRH